MKEYISTVIFDLDGTLLDTEKVFRIFWPKAMEHFGYHITDAQALTLRSLGRPFCFEYFKELSHDVNFPYDKVRNYRKKLMEEYFAQHGIERKPEAIEILELLKERGVRRAIATASDLERTNRYLKLVGLDGYFDEIISATMVEHGKPAPDIYTYACKQLGEEPCHCIAVEDSPNGVRSAYAAGCKVVMVPDLDEPDEELSKLLYGKATSLLGVVDYLDERII